jgi:hypothetical protein
MPDAGMNAQLSKNRNRLAKLRICDSLNLIPKQTVKARREGNQIDLHLAEFQ